MNEFKRYEHDTIIVRKINIAIVIISLLMLFGSLCFALFMTESRFKETKKEITHITVPSTQRERPVYHPPFYTEKQIQHNLEQCLKIYNRKWNKKDIQLATQALYVGEKYYEINHKLILTMIGVESRFKINAFNKNTNESIDFGLTQQNNEYINERYTKVSAILKKNNLEFNSSNVYDIPSNILAGYMFYNDINQTIGTENPKRFISAYNVGIRGSRLPRYREAKDKYYNAFVHHYSVIASNVSY